MPEPPSVDLRLTVPGNTPFRELAVEIVTKFAEYAGANQGIAAQFGRTADRLATSVAHGPDPVTFELRMQDAVLTVRAESGDRREQATCPLPE